MNERIKELIEECTDRHFSECVGGFETFDKEKFAELIIAECITLCDEEKAEYIKYQKNAWDREEKEIYAEGASACDTLKYKMKRMIK